MTKDNISNGSATNREFGYKDLMLRLFKFRAALSLLTSRNDPSSETGRARERERRIILSSFASALAKVISVSTALVSIPLTLHYLGEERYGMWVTLSSLAATFTFADMGMGNGILNRTSSLYGQDDMEGIRDVVSSGYAILGLICISLLVAFTAIYPSIAWFRIFNVQSEVAKAEAGPALAAFFLCFALAIPLGLVQKVQIGLQRGFAASLWQCLGSVLSLAGVLFAIHAKASIFWLVMSYMGPPLLAAALNSVYFFGKVYQAIAPRRLGISLKTCSEISRSGGMFFILQIVAAASFTSDPVIIAQVLGASSVAQYAVPEKLFSVVSMVLLIMVAPLWPAYGEAIARADYRWAKHMLNKSVRLSFIYCSVAVVVLVALAPAIVHFWLRGAIVPSYPLLIGLAVWKIIEGQGNALSMFFNGASQVRYLIIYSCVTGVVALGLKILFAREWGISGTVWATCVAYSIFMLGPSYRRIRSYFRELSQIQMQPSN